jgi:hypothetical protein
MIGVDRLVLGPDRYLMALYYAYGRKDAGGVGCYIDPVAFAEFYAAQWQQFGSGQMSFMPSVQACWDQYRRSQPK